MRILISVFSILAFVMLCPLIGTLFALVVAGSVVLLPVSLAVLAGVLFLWPLVIFVGKGILRLERGFVRAYDAVFHDHGIPQHHSHA